MLELSVACGLCLFLDQERPRFYQQCNVCDIKNLKLIGHVMTTVHVQSFVVTGHVMTTVRVQSLL